jgi:hypothetical protein
VHIAGAVAIKTDQGLAGTPTNVGSFSTLQSLFSFTGATAVVTLIWRFFPTAAGWSTLPFICALVGLLIWIFNITDPAVSPPPTSRDKFFGFILAAVNTLQLYAACLGTKVVTG